MRRWTIDVWENDDLINQWLEQLHTSSFECHPPPHTVYSCPPHSPFSLHPHLCVSFPGLLIIRPKIQIHKHSLQIQTKRYLSASKGLISWHSFCLNKTSLLYWYSRNGLMHHNATGCLLLLDSLCSLNLYSGRPGSVSTPIQHHCLWPPARHAKMTARSWFIKQISTLYFCCPILSECGIFLWNVYCIAGDTDMA